LLILKLYVSACAEQNSNLTAVIPGVSDDYAGSADDGDEPTVLFCQVQGGGPDPAINSNAADRLALTIRAGRAPRCPFAMLLSNSG
jgi:hypothetical protein